MPRQARQASGTLVNEPISDDVACLDIEDASKGRPSDDQVMMLISHVMKQEPVPVFVAVIYPDKVRLNCY